MNGTKSTVIALLTFLGLAGLPSLAQTAGQPPVTAQTPAVTDTQTSSNPEMNQALDMLRQARANMAKASDEFGGHKAKAAALTDEAIRELEVALQPVGR